MVVIENPQFTRDYFDPEKRYIGNSVQVFFKDGTPSEKISIDYPIGHRKRRAEGIPVLEAKFEKALSGHLAQEQVRRILQACASPEAMENMQVSDFIDLFTT
jgi:2-methylcitrate dehydratase